jgi:hypothetical protein
MMLEVFGGVDRRHAPEADFAFDAISARKGCRQMVQ